MVARKPGGGFAKPLELALVPRHLLGVPLDGFGLLEPTRQRLTLGVRAHGVPRLGGCVLAGRSERGLVLRSTSSKMQRRERPASCTAATQVVTAAGSPCGYRFMTLAIPPR